MYKISTTKHFEKDLVHCKKQGLDLRLLAKAIAILEECGKLPQQYKPHKLSGKFQGAWECHIKADWLLVWEQNDTELVLLFTNTGTHAELFK